MPRKLRVWHRTAIQLQAAINKVCQVMQPYPKQQNILRWSWGRLLALCQMAAAMPQRRQRFGYECLACRALSRTTWTLGTAAGSQMLYFHQPGGRQTSCCQGGKNLSSEQIVMGTAWILSLEPHMLVVPLRYSEMCKVKLQIARGDW